MQTILVTGGTGFVGKSLVPLLLNRGYHVIILTRSVTGKLARNNLRYAEWDINKQYIDPEALASADAIIHLAGAGVVDKRWSAAYKKEILDSRVNSGKLIIDTLQKNPNKVKTIIGSSAIGWYGPDREDGRPFSEDNPAADDFLGSTCRLWEESIDGAASLGIRVCKLRTGIVLGNGGGALEEFKKPLRLGVAGILGSGKQVVSWIHMNDLCSMFLYALENTSMHGSYNAVAPNPVSNRTLTMTLAKISNGNWFIPLPVPSFMLQLIMGESSIEVLKSTTVSAEKIMQAGFTFSFPKIDAAIHDLLKR